MPRPSTSVGRKRLCSAASRALTERCPSIQVQKKPWHTRWIPSFRISVEFRFVEFSQSSFECPCPLKDVATAPAVQSRRSFFWNYPIRSFFPAYVCNVLSPRAHSPSRWHQQLESANWDSPGPWPHLPSTQVWRSSVQFPLGCIFMVNLLPVVALGVIALWPSGGNEWPR